MLDINNKCVIYLNTKYNNCIFKVKKERKFEMSMNRLPAQSMQQSSTNLQFSQQLLNAFQLQKQQIHTMKEQNKILASLNQKVNKKDSQIEQLQKIINKYKKYYDEYEQVRATLNQKSKELERATQQNKILFGEVNKLISENKQLQQKLLAAERVKHDFVRQRNAADARNRQIQQTFRQYQDQCKGKIKQLIRDAEKSQAQNKQLQNKIQELHSVKFENEQLKNKIHNIQSMQLNSYSKQIGEAIDQNQENYSQNKTENNSAFLGANQMTFHSQNLNNPRNNLNNVSKSKQKSPNKSNSRVYDQEASSEIDRLRRELINKQIQFQRSKSLNHELSIEFDKSVNKICEFQKQLSMYRKQNHELKKTLSLFVEKQQYQKMHKNKIRNNPSQQSSEEEDQSASQSQQVAGFSHSQISDSRR